MAAVLIVYTLDIIVRTWSGSPHNVVHSPSDIHDPNRYIHRDLDQGYSQGSFG